jgi:1,2-diacylglycerol 3-beta-galactosyltransferase
MGFTEDVAHWMRLADYFIGKPGPGSISEAIHCGLPVIVTRNAWTMPQERFNTDWVRDRSLGQVVSATAHIPQAVDRLTSHLAVYQQAVSQHQNRALFEVVDVLCELMPESTAVPVHSRDAAACLAPA